MVARRRVRKNSKMSEIFEFAWFGSKISNLLVPKTKLENGLPCPVGIDSTVFGQLIGYLKTCRKPIFEFCFYFFVTAAESWPGGWIFRKIGKFSSIDFGCFWFKIDGIWGFLLVSKTKLENGLPARLGSIPPVFSSL